MRDPAEATCPECGKRVAIFRHGPGRRLIFEGHVGPGGQSLVDGDICDASGWVVEDADLVAEPTTVKPGHPTLGRRVCSSCGRSIAVDGGRRLVDHLAHPMPPSPPCEGSGLAA